MGHKRYYVNLVWLNRADTTDAFRQTATSWTHDSQFAPALISRLRGGKDDKSQHKAAGTAENT